MSAGKLPKTTRDVAISTSYEAGCESNKTAIAVGAAAWRTNAFRMLLGSLIIKQIINITIGIPINFTINAFFIEVIWSLILDRFNFLNQPRCIPTIIKAKTITILDGIQRKMVICSSQGDKWINIAPINPFIAWLTDIAFIKFFQYVELCRLFESLVKMTVQDSKLLVLLQDQNLCCKSALDLEVRLMKLEYQSNQYYRILIRI